MFYDRPRCEYCGKFINTNPKTIRAHWDGTMVYTGGPTPEPSHDVFWHIKCKDKPIETKEMPNVNQNR